MKSNEEHHLILNSLYEFIPIDNIFNILDCGSGRTSLLSLSEKFKSSHIDAFVYYNDLRKINSINENVVNYNFSLEEKDICKDKIDKKYDLVLAHLLLGESIMCQIYFCGILN